MEYVRSLANYIEVVRHEHNQGETGSMLKYNNAILLSALEDEYNTYQELFQWMDNLQDLQAERRTLKADVVDV
jgi:hypothetical protein